MIEEIEARRLLSADLSVSFTGKLPTTLMPGQPAKLTVRLSNVGDTTASGAASVTLSASTDASLDGADVRLADSVKSLNLKPGKSKSVKLKFTTPAALTGSNYNLLAAVDTGSSAIADANPANNVAATPVAVTQPSVDLVVQFAELPAHPLEAFAGGYGSTAVVSIFNNGNTISRSPVTVNVHLSTDSTLDANGDVLLGTAQLNAKQSTIKPGKRKDVLVYLQPPPVGTAMGTYSLIANVDPSNLVTEVNESNNLAVSPTQVPVVNTPPPTYTDHHYHSSGYYWTGGAFIDDYYYYDDGEWYYTDDPVIVDQPDYQGGGSDVNDDGGNYGNPDDTPPPPPPSDDDGGEVQTPPPPPPDDSGGGSGPDPSEPPPPDVTPSDPPTDDGGNYDTPPDPWNDNGGSTDVMPDPGIDYGGGGDTFDDWG